MHDHQFHLNIYERTSIQEKNKKNLNLISQFEPELWPFKEIGVENDY